MHTRLLVTWFLLAVGCGSSAVCTFNSDCPAGSFCEMGACRVECSPTQPCPNAGEVCTRFGQCVAGDAGMPVDAGPRVDAGTDGGPPPVDAGPPPEICTPSTAGSVPEDEDADGAVDEDCEWHFGVPHPVIDAHVASSLDQYYPRLSADGLRLYLGARAGSTHAPFVAARPSRSERFGAPQLVPGDWAGMNVYVVSLTGDELELYAQVRDGSTREGVYRATRASTSVAFSRPVPVNEAWVDATRQSRHPFVTPDGLELFFSAYTATTNVVYRSRRSDRSAGWGAPELVTIGSPPADWVEGPSLSPDGRTLFVSFVIGGEYRAHHATRDDTASATFGAAALIADMPQIIEASYAEPTRELWVNARGPFGPTADWSLWRVEVCRDGPCPTREIDCPSPGVRSPDGLHCYATGSTASWAAARTACEAGGGHLATVHSRAEMDLLWSQFASMAAPWLWMGGYDDMGLVAECVTSQSCPWGWVSGEPWTFPGWSPTEPSNSAPDEDCAVLWDGIGLGDAPCGSSQVSICERDLWPTW